MFTSICPVSLVSVPHFDVDLAIQNSLSRLESFDYGFCYNILQCIAMMFAIYIVDPLGINMLENQFLNKFRFDLRYTLCH